MEETSGEETSKGTMKGVRREIFIFAYESRNKKAKE